jgi:hypothetical protein
MIHIVQLFGNQAAGRGGVRKVLADVLGLNFEGGGEGVAHVKPT